MTKYLQCVAEHAPPANKQARELLEYAVTKYGYEKFSKKDFLVDLKEQIGKDTALKGSKANPALTFNYYVPGLLFYGHMDMFEDDTKLVPKLGSIDPFNRKGRPKGTGGTKKGMSLMDELKMLQARIVTDRARIVEIGKALEEAAKLASTVVTETEGTETELIENDEDDGGELTEEEMEAATDPNL